MHAAWHTVTQLLRDTGDVALQPGAWPQWLALLLALAISMLAARLHARRDVGVEIASIRRAFADSCLGSGLFVCLALTAAPLLRLEGIDNTLALGAALLGVLWLLIALTFIVVASQLAALPLASRGARVVALALWLGLALQLLGWLPAVLQMIDAVAIPIGNKRVSLLDAARTSLIVLLFGVGAVYAGAYVERRLMLLSHVPIGVRVGTAKLLRVLLIVLAVLVAFNTVGVDLTALTVLGGAIGVGVGLGMQRTASNFISGFVLLGDRSIRPGDVITIGERFGVVRELRARYVVVRDRDGVDTLIPNEHIITSEVVNWSYADRNIRLKLPLQISYQDDPRAAMHMMTEAARRHRRVSAEPDPVARVIRFADNGIEIELRFWISDPEDG
ncbi:MAG: mechanosensitive ion channel domain-containing protein, partial [Gammaproteobacteria bacterium]